MFSKMTQALILSGCLLAAGAANANERDVIVPVIAGAAVGAILATVISQGHERPRYEQYRPQPRYQPRYQPQYQAVRYVPVRTVEYRRYNPAPYGYRDGGHRRDYDHYRRNDRW